MDLLDIARGPLLQWSIAIFVFGMLWRLTGVLLLRPKPDLSEPRNPAAWKGLRLIWLRSWPRREFVGATAFTEVMGYVFHIGMLVPIFFFLPHVLFFTDIFRGILGFTFRDAFGFSWPTLPGGVVYFLSAVSVAALFAVLVHRLTNPVKRLISNFDDYFSWLVTTAPLVTGMVAYGHVWGKYETWLALHLLSVELLLVWFPFGKLMHALTIFASRSTEGILFERKGASL